jgi:hypothetical protein
MDMECIKYVTLSVNGGGGGTRYDLLHLLNTVRELIGEIFY